MASRLQKITLLPALVLYNLSILFSLISLIITDFSLKQSLLVLILSLLLGAVIYSVYWGYSWFWSRKIHENGHSIIFRFLSHNKLLIIIFLILGSATLIWVFQLIWKDLVVWNKDLGAIFFGSRINEFIGFGIGMKVVHYFFIGLTFLLTGLAILVHSRRACPYYFGYLGSIYRKTGISLKMCFKCPLEKDCRWTDKRSKFSK